MELVTNIYGLESWKMFCKCNASFLKMQITNTFSVTSFVVEQEIESPLKKKAKSYAITSETVFPHCSEYVLIPKYLVFLHFFSIVWA